MTPSITENLTKLGLLEREAAVYVALLELGESPVIPISRKSGIQRTYVYDILETLRKRNLVTAIEKGGRTTFRAESPKVLERQITERLQLAKDTLPELLSLYNLLPGKPKVRFYEGKEGILAVYDEMMEEKAYDNLGNPDNFREIMGEAYTREIGERIARNKIRTRELYTRPSTPLVHDASYDPRLQEIRFLPEDHQITTDVCISATKVYLVSLDRNPHCVIIEDSGIIYSMKVMFEVMWNSAKN